MDLDAFYARAPVPVQHVFATAHGARERWRRRGGTFADTRRALDDQQWWEEGDLRRLCEARLRATVATAVHHVPHYRDLFAQRGLVAADVGTVDDLGVLPLLDKEDVRARPERFTDPTVGPVLEQTTGGTTGTPLRYWATPAAVQWNYATYDARLWWWAGVRFGQRLASFNGKPVVPASQAGPPYWRSNLAFNQLYFSVYHLSDTTLPRYADRLARFAPEVVVGYTTAVHRLARFLVARGDERIRPRAVLVSSETLHPWMAADIETAFGCPVWNGYSLGELVAWASTCEHGGMHVSPEYGVIELVEGPDGREIVATGLINPAMPLIRYRTGDVVADEEIPARCPCGRRLPLLPTILGRVDDVVCTPEGFTVGPAPMSLAFQGVPHLREAQIHQDDPDRIRVLVAWGAGHVPDDDAFLGAELRRRLGPGVAIELEPVEVVPRTGGGKQRLVVSSVGRRPGRP